MVAAIHPLTPGSPAYAVAKVTAVGGLIALRMVLSRRSRRGEEGTNDAPEPGPEPTVRHPHPVSRRKTKRRRKRR